MRIAIVGCGFAGLSAAEEIGRRIEADILLIDRKRYFENLALLPEFLSGKVSESEVKGDIKRFAEKIGANFIEGEVYNIDFAKKQMHIRHENETSVENYDFLVISVGAEPSFFGIPGAEEHSFTVNSLENTLNARKHLEKLREAVRSSERGEGRGGEDERKVDVVVVGAGLTGVEVAGEVVDFFGGVEGFNNVKIVEMMPRVLPAMPEKVSKYVRSELAQRGVQILTGHAVKSVRADEIVLKRVRPSTPSSSSARSSHSPVPSSASSTEEPVSSSSSHSPSSEIVLRYDMLLWTAGLKPNRLAERISAPKVKGWLKTDEFLRVFGLKNVYAIGDIAHVEHAGEISGKNAEEAERQGKAAAENIVREIKGKKMKAYTPKNTVQNPRALISLGGNKAIAYFNGILLVPFAYFIKKYIDRKFMRKFA